MTRQNHETGADAFQRFNKAQGIGTVRDPYTRWAELRSMGPVLEVDPREWTGDQEFMSGGQEAPEGFKIWSAVSYDAVHDILADSRNFTSSGYAITMGPVLGRTILEMDPPEHTVHRKLLSQAFSRRALESWETGLVADTVNGLIDGFAERGSADLVRELSAREERYALAFSDLSALRVALDQDLSDFDAPLDGVREVAFFPPMTGG